MDTDVLIVGGGPAGLSAALVLARCHRQVLICDDGKPRNRTSPAIHGLLGQEGKAPSEFLASARAELREYSAVRFRTARVMNVKANGDLFEYLCEDGSAGTASKILLASGIVDELPAIPGFDRLYGTSVHHCLYCDGFEYYGKAVAAYGHGDKGGALGLMVRHWVADVVVCSDGAQLSEVLAEKLRQFAIPVRGEKVARLEGSRGDRCEIQFAEGRPLTCDALFFATGCRQASDLSERLGCKRDAKGGVITDPVTEETSVPGVYVAGDVSRDVLMVSIAIAEGAKAAIAINKAFLLRDGFCA